MTRPPSDPVAVVEVVCTGNICRSPYAEALLRAAAAERLEDPSLVLVRSCGTRGLVGEPAADGSIREAARRGLDLSDHVAAQWSEHRGEDADLVITMTEDHREHVIAHAAAARATTFTLRELVRLVAAAGPLGGRVPARERVVRLAGAADRARGVTPGPDEPEDVADPYGGPQEGYAHMAAQIDRLVLALADDLFGPVSDGDATLFGGA